MADPLFPEHPRLVRGLTHSSFQVIYAVLTLMGIVYFTIASTLSPNMMAEIYPLEDALFVERVYANGPAEKAGVCAGDFILSINGHSINEILDQSLYKPFPYAGNLMVIKVEREGRTIILPMTPVDSNTTPSSLITSIGLQLLAIGIYIVGLTLSLFTSPQDVGPRMVAMSFLTAAAGIAATGPGDWFSLNTIAYTTMMSTSCLAVAFFVISHLYFPALSFSARRRRFIVHAFIFVAILLSVLEILENLDVFDTLIGIQYLDFYLYDFISGFEVLALGTGMGLLVYKRLAARDADVRQQANIIVLGTAIGVTPYTTVALFDSFGSPSSLIYLYAMFFCLLIPLSYAYTIYRRQLIRVDFAINRAVVLFSFTFVTLITFSLLSLGIAYVLDLPAGVAFIGGVSATLASLLAAPLRGTVQRHVDRVLYGCHYDFASITTGFSERLAQAIDRNALTQLLAQDLARRMGIRRAALLLAEGSTLELQSADGEPFSVPSDDLVCQALLAANRPAHADPLLEKHPCAQTQWQPFAWVRLFVPLIFQGRLQGILLLSDRFFGDIYSATDLRIIATVAHQAALAYENVQLVESLRGLNRQIVRSEEAYRKQVARDLHDATMQHLCFVKQGFLEQGRLYQKGEHADTTDLVALLDNIVITLRRTIRGLRPPLLDQGLHLALKGLVNEMHEIIGESPAILLRSNVEKQLGLSDEQATALYRIAQEALSNAIKHARAQQVIVTLEKTGDSLLLSVDDDGTGSVRDWAGHYGLVGMRERAAMVGAHLKIASAPSQGTHIAVKVTPYTDQY